MKEKYSFFTSNELKPSGWMLEQLRLQANGLNGNLDKVWPDVRDSAWVGGPCEGWERVPYWLDGFVPLAYLLNDADMIARAKRYVDKIVERQEPDGWICPVTPDKRKNYDTWAVMLISKVLTRYYECSRDDRIPDVLYRTMKNYHELLQAGEVGIGFWGKYRWFESFPALNLLWRTRPEAWMKELAKYLFEHGKDYREAEALWVRPLNKWTLDTHIVNLCQMLKSEVLSCDLLDEEEKELAERYYQLLKKYNGTAVGTFTGDECLSGVSPTQGTELCAVVELMDSMEQIYAYTGDAKWAERLERVSFNALPATITEDMWAHQYVQQVNQIDCTPFPGKSHFRTNGNEAHRFGLEPHFGCCTANFGQGWPKLALSAFMRSKNGVHSAVPIPAELTTDWKGVPVKVTLATEYPFRNTFVYRVEAEKKTSMKLTVRIPSFAKNLTVNGASVAKRPILTFGGFEAGVTEITIAFETEAALEGRPHGMTVLRYGSLIFSYPVKAQITPVEYERQGVPRKFPYCDYDYKGVSDWNVAFADRTFTVEEHGITAAPFSVEHPPITVKASLCHIDWGLADGYQTVCAATPQSRRPLDDATTQTLVPYACAKLRMTELPVVKKG